MPSQPPRRRDLVSLFTIISSHRLLVITALVMIGVAAVAISRSYAFKASSSRSVAPALASGQESNNRTRSKTSIAVMEFAGLRHRAAPSNPSSVLVPTVTASKADSLFTDVDGDLLADPGDTLQYSVNISATGDDATGVSFTDTVDPNTTFVPGSLTATPVAVDDSYSAIGNVRISVPAPGVLGNDFAGVPAATITGAPSSFSSTNGGDVTLNADGSFTYNPAAGFEGSDTFTYTLTNASGSNSATVTIAVSGMIWFINNNPGACVSGCDGRLTTPFTSLSAFAAVNNGVGNNPAANDNIFSYESAVDYVGPVTLLNGQRFIGQDATASLSAITGLTPPTYSDPLPAMNSANAVITNITSAGNSINVASGNTLRGFTGGNSVSDINGTAFGTLTIADVTLNGTGRALNLTTGTLAATFVSISSTASTTTGISLTSVAGSLTNPTTTITNPVGIGLTVNTSSASLNFGNTSSTLSGGTGVSLTTNTGAITFGALNITPDPGQRGLLATDNTLTITSTSGAITTTTATAVEITRGVGTTPLAIAQTSVASTGGANGIRLSNTSGSFTVAGSGGTCTFLVPTCSGGRITASTGADGSTAGIGVNLNNVTNISLTSMRIDNHPNFGIRGHGVVGFTLQSSVVDGNNGTSATADTDIVNGEDSIRIINLTGSALIDDCFIGGGYEQNLRIVNNTGTLNRLTVSDTSIGDLDGAGPGRGTDTTNGDDNVIVAAFEGITQMNSTFSNNILNNGRGDVFQASNSDVVAPAGTMDAVFRNNTVTNNHPNIAVGGGGVTFNGTGAMTYDISCNSFRDSEGHGLNVFKARPANGQTGGTWSGTIFNNTVGVTGVADSGGLGSGINVDAQGNGTHTTLIKNNEIRQHNLAGITLNVVDANTVAPLAVTLNATVIGNLVAEGGASAFTGFLAVQGAVSGADVNTTLNLKLGGAGAEQNDFTDGDPTDFADVFLFQGVPPDGSFNLTRGNSVSSDVPTVVRDNNVTPLTVYPDPDDGTVIVVAPVPALPAATNQTCTPPALMATTESPEEMARIKSDADGDVSNILRSTSGENQNRGSVPRLTPSELQVMTEAAIGLWADAGATLEEIARMKAVSLQIADLPDGQLATVSTNEIKIDESAAGYGWYFDATPSDDSEFDVSVPNKELQSSELNLGHGKMDLLTVIMRQLGTLRQKSGGKAKQSWLMQNTLGTGVRRAPVQQAANRELSKSKGSTPANPVAKSLNRVKPIRSNNQKAAVRRAVGQKALSHHATGLRAMVNNAQPTVSSMLADVNLSIGTLPAGESVAITFRVTVNDPFMGALPQVSNQGTVSGSNFSSVLTDDPAVGGTADPTVTPIDLPLVSVAVSPSSVLEDGATNLVYTFTRTGSTANAITVNFSVGGSASFPGDYSQSGAATFTASSGTVVIPGGSSTAAVTIDPSADNDVESDDTVNLTVTSGTGYAVGSPSAASGTITNDDTNVSVAVAPSSVAEDGAGNLVYTFTRDNLSGGALVVNFSVGGSASFPGDYSQSGATTYTPPTGTVTFAAASLTATVTIDPTPDNDVETDETVDIAVAPGAGYTAGGPTASGTITNDDANVSVAVSPSSVAEDGLGNLVYTFTRDNLSGGALVVNFSVGGSASFPGDYSQSGATTYTPPTGTVTFGAASLTATVTIDPTPDNDVETDETVDIAVAPGAGYTAGGPTASGTITNDDTNVSVAVAPSSVAEDGAGNLVYTFTRDNLSGGALVVNFSVGGSASFPGDYSQSGATTYTPPTGTVTFGAASLTATVTIDPTPDNDVETDETVDIAVAPGAGYTAGGPTASGTITNDDANVSVAVSPSSVAEDGLGNLVYTFTRDNLSGGALVVNFSVGGSASFPGDYSQSGATTYTPPTGTVTFGAASLTATVTIDPTPDNDVETDETVDIAVAPGAGYTAGGPTASGTITNDDADVTVAVSPSSVAEDGATNLVYTFTRTGFTGSALTVNFSVGGSASFPGDYSQSGATTYSSSAGTVTFGVGSNTASVTIDPVSDTEIESDETVILTLTAGTGYNVSLPSSATGTITNDDADVSVAVAPAAVAEDGATNLVYTFTRSNISGGALVVNFSVGGTATFGVSPDDYTQTGATTYTTTSGTVTFAPASLTATVTVDPETDVTAEADETVIITLTAGASYNAVNPTSATGTILNDDTLVSVVVAPLSTPEGGANLVYTFTRTGPTGSALTVNFSVGGTASFLGDYNQSGAATFTPPTATVTFGAGNSTATVNVTPLSDCTVEGPETVDFTVTSGTGYGVGSPSSATGTITNTPDSTPPVISGVSANPSTLSPPNHQMTDVTINYTATDSCGGVTCVISNITSNQPINGTGDGDSSPDWEFVDEHHVRLRAERSGGVTRVYTITITCTDSAGNISTSQVQVTVP